MFSLEYDYATDIAVQREEAMQEGLEKGLEQGLEEGLEEGRVNTFLANISNIMDKLKMDKFQAMDLLGIPEAEQPKYASMIQ